MTDPLAARRAAPVAEPRRSGALPSAFVVLALLALLISPLIRQRQMEDLRDEIEHAAEPGRTLITRVQFLLARQTSTLRGYFITGDSSFLTTYAGLVEDERQAYEELAPLIQRLGEAPLSQFVELRTLSARWHERVDEDGFDESDVDGTRAAAGVPFEQDLYQQALTAAARLDQAVAQAAVERRVEIRRAEATGKAVSVVLIVLALAATLSVVLLNRRVQRLAAESEVRRRDAERALEETARTVKSREHLIRGVTHDVKNPLGAADGYAELLEMGLRGDLTAEQKKMVAGIRRSISGALQIINDLLELSRAEAGSLPIERELLSLGRLTREVVEDHRSLAAAAGHEVEVVTPEQPVKLYLDPMRVQQIIGNLLTNAVKYTPRPGRIRVELTTEPRLAPPRPGRWVAVHVSDSGPGIPAAQRERIFEEFHRLHSSAVPGHGLGLAISRRLARLLGGDLTIADDGVPGSTFTLWLPERESE